MHHIVKLLNTKQFKEALQESEKAIYLAAYKFTGGNQSQTAKLLGVARGTVITKLRQFVKTPQTYIVFGKESAPYSNGGDPYSQYNTEI